MSDCLVSPQGARCPRGLAPTAGGESNPKDVLALHSTGGRSPGTAAASPPSLQWLLEPGTCFKVGGLGVLEPWAW